MHFPRLNSLRSLAFTAGVASLGVIASVAHAGAPLLNVSYDVTREFYKDYNAAFIKHWKATSGEDLEISQSHGGSSKQAGSIIAGLEADVITMNQASDIDVLHDKAQLIPADWAKRLPNASAPTTSVTVILVRKGNPKGIKDWTDVAKPGVSVVIPNPKTSGNGRYTYLAAWGSVIKAGGDAAKAKSLVTQLFANVPVFDGGGRAATTTFAQKGIGDALATFESEVEPILAEFGRDYDVVYPRSTVLAENPVSVVDKVVDKKGTRKQAEAYLSWLWSPQAQEIAAQHRLRPRNEAVLAQYAKDFPKVSTFTVQEIFGSWKQAQKDHFADGALYDQILAVAKK